MQDLLEQNRRINLYLNGELTVTSTHRRNTENIRSVSSCTRKGYRIKKSTRRNLSSSAFLLYVKKRHQIIFLTLTFPQKISRGTKVNPFMHKYLTNLTKNYGMGNFIWVRENTKKGNPHFHLLADLPYQPIKKLNKAWCEAIGMHSNNAVRLPKNHKGIVEDIERTCKYVTKYITKDENCYYSERCYSQSRDCKAEPIRLDEFDYRNLNYDQGKNMKYKVFDHCTTCKIWDFYKNSDYFIEFLGNYSENTETLYSSDKISIEGAKTPIHGVKSPKNGEGLGRFGRAGPTVQIPIDFN